MPCGLNAHVHSTVVRPEPRENEVRYDKMMVTTPRSIPVLWYTLSIDHHGSKVTFARLVRTQQCTLRIGMSQYKNILIPKKLRFTGSGLREFINVTKNMTSSKLISAA